MSVNGMIGQVGSGAGRPAQIHGSIAADGRQVGGGRRSSGIGSRAGPYRQLALIARRIGGADPVVVPLPGGHYIRVDVAVCCWSDNRRCVDGVVGCVPVQGVAGQVRLGVHVPDHLYVHIPARGNQPRRLGREGHVRHRIRAS